MVDMILLDGVRYCRYSPKNEDEFERLVVENAAQIFGEEAIYLDIKKKIKTEWGQGTIPDGYLFYPEQKRFVLVEIELSTHDVFRHVSPQLGTFINAFSNYKSRKKLAQIIQTQIEDDVNLKARIEKTCMGKGIFDHLFNEIFETMEDEKNFECIVVVEEETITFKNSLWTLNPRPQLLEVAVYAREGAEMVKALRFVPQFNFVPARTELIPAKKATEAAPVVSTDGIDFPVPVYADYKGKHFEGRLFADGSVEVNGEKFNSPSGAGKAAKDGKSTNGWTFWQISNSKETIDKLYHIIKGTKKEYRSSPEDLDTIIVPAQEDGFQETFLGENCWYAIRLNERKIPNLRFIAVYRKAPVSAITHLAEIDRIEKYKDTGKFIVYFKGMAKEINHIKRVNGGFAPQCPVFTNYQRLIEAKSTSDAI